jgi:hypothetical protein
MFHSGDWSNWDLHVSASVILANRQEWLNSMRERLSTEEIKLFYALSYFAVRAPTLWLWDRNGYESLSVRATLGKTRSGSGEFILDNNVENRAISRYLFEETHTRLNKMGRKGPCKSRLFWPTFASQAMSKFGWLAKPSAQFSHPLGFVACRCIFSEVNGFLPHPSITSVVRNWVNPAYDPQEYPLNSVPWMQARFRDVLKTLAWSPRYKLPLFEGSGTLGEGLGIIAMRAGVEDPYGVDDSDGDISRSIGRIKKLYSTGSFLSS